MSATQLTDPTNFKVENIIFGDAKENTMEVTDKNKPDARPEKVTFYRIDIKYRNDDGTIGDLILGFDKCTSAFGLNMNYGTFHINMADKPPTELQQKTIDVFNEISDRCRDHLIEVKVTLGKPRMTRANLEGEKDINPMKYAKKDFDPNTGEPIPGAIPNLSVKLLPAGKKDTSGKRFKDTFYAEEDDSVIEAESLVDKRCNVRAAVKVESIFVGQVIKIQTKLYEAIIKMQDTGSRRLLQAFRPAPTQSTGVTTYDPLAASNDSDNEEDQHEIKADSDNEQEQEPEPVKEEPKGRKGKGRK